MLFAGWIVIEFYTFSVKAGANQIILYKFRFCMYIFSHRLDYYQNNFLPTKNAHARPYVLRDTHLLWRTMGLIAKSMKFCWQVY